MLQITPVAEILLKYDFAVRRLLSVFIVLAILIDKIFSWNSLNRSVNCNQWQSVKWDVRREWPLSQLVLIARPYNSGVSVYLLSLYFYDDQGMKGYLGEWVFVCVEIQEWLLCVACQIVVPTHRGLSTYHPVWLLLFINILHIHVWWI